MELLFVALIVAVLWPETFRWVLAQGFTFAALALIVLILVSVGTCTPARADTGQEIHAPAKEEMF